MAKVKKQVGEIHKFGFVNYKGEEIIPCNYDKVERFKDGRKVVVVCKNGLCELIKQNGEALIPIKFISIYDKEDGTYQVNDGAEQYIIDGNAKRVQK